MLFLRPTLLLALIPVALVLYLLHRRRGATGAWQKVIAPHLLPQLFEGREMAGRLRPEVLLGFVLTLAVLAAAGPSWAREPSPFGEDEAALIVVVEASESMLAQDLQPTRMERVTLKIADLMAERKGARTALVVYAGSAHLVLPLTRDTELLASMAAELSPQIMPAEGDSPSKALEIASRQLRDLPGSVLLITDGIPAAELELLRKYRSEGGPRIHVLAAAAGSEVPLPLDGPPAMPLDRSGLEKAARALGGTFVEIRPDNEDVQVLTRAVETQFSSASDGEGLRWKDAGYSLVPLIALISLVWFRPGWSVNWNGMTPFIILGLLGGPGLIEAQEMSEDRKVSIKDLFMTPDQQAQQLFDKGNFIEAAELFTDPMWRGTAWYRAGEFKKASAFFGQVGTPEGLFNRGNALLMLGQYVEAVAAYRLVIKARPDWEAPQINMSIAEAREGALAPPEDKVAKDKLTKDDAPDEIVFDDQAKNNPNAAEDEFAGEGAEMDDKAMRELWLKRVETRPADFLRNKFAYQFQMEGEDE